ncbi:thermonuclease family protein [Cytobacillus sp. FJAT-54145]|uniref:Thermonuclease family protein n=1 Tax=Cytobacillus spartinae TaxID=3299023 RepID=A0ABW6KA23_9BACI
MSLDSSETAYAEEPSSKRVNVKLSKPIDGDTIEVVIGKKTEKVRYLLVDAPETSHPKLGVQPFGKEAKDFNASVVQKAKKLELEFDVSERDKYGRLLAYVYADGKSVQEELLKRGLVRVAYVYAPNTKYVDKYRSLQKEAMKKGVGIYSIENYVQEDGFHPEVIKKKTSTPKTSPSSSCVVKGNIASSGEKIYHIKGGASYNSVKPEACFKTEQEAKNAGYRKAKR